MNTYTTFENINGKERFARFAIAFAVLLAAMHSSIAGGTVAFVTVSFAVVILATLAILGWCPLVESIKQIKAVSRHVTEHGVHFHHGRHA